MRSILTHAALIGGLALAAPAAGAEEPAPVELSTACTTYIDALPYTISAPGHYCLKANRSTGHFLAVVVNSPDATLDCRNRAIEFQGGANASGTDGVVVSPGANDATVQNCTIRGFDRGIRSASSAADVTIRNNRIERFLTFGIQGGGDRFNVVNNRVTDGGSLDNAATGIWVAGDPAQPATGQVIVNNLIAGLHGLQVTGIGAYASQGLRLVNNHIMGLRVNGNAAWAYGIVAYGGGLSDLQVINNTTSAMAQDQLFFPMYADPAPTLCRGNTVYNNPNLPFANCVRSIDNTTVQTPMY